MTKEAEFKVVHLLLKTLHLFLKPPAEHSFIVELPNLLPELTQLDFVCKTICTMLI